MIAFASHRTEKSSVSLHLVQRPRSNEQQARSEAAAGLVPFGMHEEELLLVLDRLCVSFHAGAARHYEVRDVEAANAWHNSGVSDKGTGLRRSRRQLPWTVRGRPEDVWVETPDCSNCVLSPF